MSGRLSHAEIKELVDAALGCGLEELASRELLFRGLPRSYFAGLKPGPNPADQLRSDLDDLSRAELVGHDPLLVWLRNAEDRAEPREQAAVFRRLRERLSGPLPEKAGQPIVSTHQLPGGSSIFLGRDAELALLERAWADPGTRVQSLIALGGAGKTAVMRRWLNDLGQRGYAGAARVYVWSFYLQGRQSSSDLFIDQMLRWLGDPKPEEGDPWQKGERLAVLIRKQRTLLLLDGVEPLQHPPGAMFGKLKDPALEVLLKSLADQMDGLCVVSSQLPLTDLDAQTSGGYRAYNLERLSAETGAELLRQRGVRGEEDELRKAVEEHRGHALALQLLGSYLATYEKGDLHRRVAVRGLTELEDGGEHARRVMRAYEPRLDSVDLAVLRLVSLFDRTAEAKALAALRAPPTINGLTNALKGVKHLSWRRAVTHLRQLGLLAETEGDGLDAHPLVREHFSARLREIAPKAWRAAQERLYQYFAAAAPHQPDTLKAMEPLFRAVVHGCAAGLHEEVLVDVFGQRIRRGAEGYTFHKLGAFEVDMVALAGFFAEPWSHPQPSLSEAAQAVVLNWAGFGLRALGRLADAVAPMEAALGRQVKRGDQQTAAVDAASLSELQLTLGRLDVAEDRAREALVYADRSGEGFVRMATHSNHADVLHRRGKPDAARILFVEAERLQVARQPSYPLLYSLAGYHYGELLLAEGQIAEAQRRAEQTLVWSKQEGYPLDASLDYLLLGRAALANTHPDFVLAARYLDAAVTGLRSANHQEFIAIGLLARAALHRAAARFPDAYCDLNEARTIAERGGMRLHLCDCHLESARLHLAENNPEAARRAYEFAKSEVQAMGYHRRDPELAALAAALDPSRPEDQE